MPDHRAASANCPPKAPNVTREARVGQADYFGKEAVVMQVDLSGQKRIRFRTVVPSYFRRATRFPAATGELRWSDSVTRLKERSLDRKEQESSCGVHTEFYAKKRGRRCELNVVRRTELLEPTLAFAISKARIQTELMGPTRCLTGILALASGMPLDRRAINHSR